MLLHKIVSIVADFCSDLLVTFTTLFLLRSAGYKVMLMSPYFGDYKVEHQ